MDYYKVVDNGRFEKYFTVMPNIVDDMNLSVYAYRLYFHLRRVISEFGSCDQSTETLAKHCKMSLGSITNAKKELLKNNLIVIKEEPSRIGKNFHIITLVDIGY